MKSSTTITTEEAQRIAKRLTNHWKHKFDIETQDQVFKIFMPKATIQLETHDISLDVSIEAVKEITQEELTHLEQVVVDHINRMVQANYEAEWKQST